MRDAPLGNTPLPEPVTHAQFMVAAASNDVPTLCRYLAQGGNADLVNAAGESALVVATRTGHEAFLVELLKAEPKLDLDWEGSAIELAFKTGQAHLAAHLYRAAIARARPVTIDEVRTAIDRNDVQVVRRYLAQGHAADPHESEDSPLYTACTTGRHAIAALLCAAGANPFTSHHRLSPLSAAARRGDGPMVQMLLDGQRPSGATPAAIRDGLFSALLAAAREHRPGAVAQLLTVARPLPENAVVTLAVAVLTPSPHDARAASETLRVLLRSTDQSRRPELRGGDGSTLLHHAAAVNAHWGIDVLVEEGIPVDFAEQIVDDGATPFLTACKNGSLGSMRRLAAQGAALERRTTAGADALTLAIEGCDPDDDELAHDGELLLDNAPLKDVIACLLELGCDPDALDGEGYSARMRVAGSPELTSLINAYAARKAMQDTLTAAGAKP